ncbi:MAG: hypothetical protein NC548_36905 [Lachnospiraceae bacterium]|nr:hypothetical protein [Lachnospiraceae bacterium]
MTVGELINALSEYDRELEVKAESNFGDKFEIEHVWQFDNEREPKLNEYLTIQLFEL